MSPNTLHMFITITKVENPIVTSSFVSSPSLWS